MVHFTKMGIRVLLNTLTSQQLSIVWQAKLLLLIINFSKSLRVGHPKTVGIACLSFWTKGGTV